MLFSKFANNPNKSPEPGFVEKVCYGLGDFSSNIVYATTQVFLMYYYTEYCDVNILTVSTIFLLSRFFDGFSDLVVGTLVDRTKSPYGKTRVWILRMLIPYYLTLVFLFSVPSGMGETATLAYIFVTYNLTITVVYTAINLPYGALTTLISKDSYQRSIVTIYRMIFSTSGATIATAVTIPMVEFFGNDRMAWTYTFIILGGIATVLFFFTFVSCQERVVSTVKTDSTNIPFKVQLKSLFANKYWAILTCLILLVFGADIAFGAASVYYYKYFLSDPKYIGIFTVLTTCVRLALMVAVLPILLRKIGKRNCVAIGCAVCALAFGLRYLDPYSLPLNFVCATLIGVGQTFTYACLWAMVPDAVDYGEYINKFRTEGLVYSGSSFATKVANGIFTVLAGFVINLGGYVNNAPEQTQEALDYILYAATIVPVSIYALAGIFVYLYKLDHILPEVIRTITQNRTEGQDFSQSEREILSKSDNAEAKS